MGEWIQVILEHINSMGYRFDWKELILGLATPLFIGALFVEMYFLRDRPEIFKLKEIISIKAINVPNQSFMIPICKYRLFLPRIRLILRSQKTPQGQPDLSAGSVVLVPGAGPPPPRAVQRKGRRLRRFRRRDSGQRPAV